MKTVMVALIHPMSTMTLTGSRVVKASTRSTTGLPNFRMRSKALRSIACSKAQTFPNKLRHNYFSVHHMLRPILIKHGWAKSNTQGISISRFESLYNSPKPQHSRVTSQDPSLCYFIKENWLFMPHSFPQG